MNQLQISVVMPALNEEENIKGAALDVIHAFRALNIRGEIVIVNDGSTDGTREIAEALAREYSEIKVIHHDRPQGIGASFWDGAVNGRGDVVTMLPGDGENDASEILRYLPLAEHVDVVIPFVYNKEIRSSARRAVSKLYKSIINLSFGMLLNYMNGTVMYRRSALLTLNLKSKGFFYQTELLIKAIRKGYLYAEVPYALRNRAEGDSKALTLKSFRRLSRDYLKMLAAVYFDKEIRLGAGINKNTITATRRCELGLYTRPEPVLSPMRNSEQL